MWSCRLPWSNERATTDLSIWGGADVVQQERKCRLGGILSACSDNPADSKVKDPKTGVVIGTKFSRYSRRPRILTPIGAALRKSFGPKISESNTSSLRTARPSIRHLRHPHGNTS